MNQKFSLAALAFSLVSASAAFAQEAGPAGIANSYEPAVTVCDMKVKTVKKAEQLCSAYRLGVVKAEGTKLFECDCLSSAAGSTQSKAPSSDSGGEDFSVPAPTAD